MSVDYAAGRLDRIILRLNRTGRLDRIGKKIRDRITAARWRRLNEKRLLAGCRCGARPSWVHRDYSNPSGVPVMIFYCDAHRGVNHWIQDNVTLAWEPGDSPQRLTTLRWTDPPTLRRIGR